MSGPLFTIRTESHHLPACRALARYCAGVPPQSRAVVKDRKSRVEPFVCNRARCGVHVLRARDRGGSEGSSRRSVGVAEEAAW